MKREDLTEKILDIKREKGWTWKHICGADRRHVAGDDHRRAARQPQADQAAGRGRRQAVRPLQERADDAQRGAEPRRGCRDAADRPADLPLLRAGAGQRPGLEGADRGGVRRRHHVGDRLRHGDGAAAPTRRATASRSRMSGKFLPFKYYGATGNAQAYGYKEE